MSWPTCSNRLRNGNTTCSRVASSRSCAEPSAVGMPRVGGNGSIELEPSVKTSLPLASNTLESAMPLPAVGSASRL